MGSKISRTVFAEAKYDGQSRQVAKTGGLVYAHRRKPTGIPFRYLHGISDPGVPRMVYALW